MLATLAQVAPGTPLREGIDRILSANSGGLIVLSDGPNVRAVCTGGFTIDTEFEPHRLSELSKMDGAVVCDEQASRIVKANVHLMPDLGIPTTETGTRHRTAERVARQTGCSVIAVSKRLTQISVYQDDEKRLLQPVTRVLGRANQATATLERYRARFDAVSASLSALEVEDLVTVRDVLLVLQRGEMVRRIAAECEVLLVELGVEGRLLHLQVEELGAGIDAELLGVARDYATISHCDAEEMIARLRHEPTELLTESTSTAKSLGVDAGLDTACSPRGYRFLSRIPRLTLPIMDRITERFGTLQKILNASINELEEIDGVGGVRALQIKEGLARIAESSILDRYG